MRDQNKVLLALTHVFNLILPLLLKLSKRDFEIIDRLFEFVGLFEGRVPASQDEEDHPEGPDVFLGAQIWPVENHLGAVVGLGSHPSLHHLLKLRFERFRSTEICDFEIEVAIEKDVFKF